MSLIIGLTGGIGSGKSTVANEFKKLGIEVVDADVVAREVVELGQPALNKIKEYFGGDILDKNNALDRTALRHIIFNSESKKDWLNKLLHPIIRDKILENMAAAKSPYVILEAPLLFENNLNQYTQYNIVVDIAEKKQIQRAAKRDGTNEAQIQAIMDAQLNRDERLKKADFIIDNNEADQVAFKLRIESLHSTFLSFL